MNDSQRSGRALIDATRVFAAEDRARSWRELALTLGLLVLSTIAAAMLHPGLARAPFTVISGLLLVRMFILFHDFMHGAILRGSRIAAAIFRIYGISVMTPPNVWRETHNYHHAHTAKLVGSHIGSYPMVTPAIWAMMSARQRLAYRAARNPLTIALGYFTIFFVGMCVTPFARAPRKHWDSGAALVMNVAMTALIVRFFGWSMFFFAYGGPLVIATALGAYLFYAQHNFPDVKVEPRETWSYTRAALESSSYMETGPVMRFFTGNIGYHHVHHLNPSIPFYRLPEAMDAIPELQHPGRTSLGWHDVVACLRLKIWDPASAHMTGYDATESAPATLSPRS